MTKKRKAATTGDKTMAIARRYGTPAQPTPEDIKAARIRLGLTQSAMADLMGLGDAPRIAEYENGTRAPSPEAWRHFLLITDAHRTLQLRRRIKQTPSPR